MVSRQPSNSDLNSYYRDVPPSPKSPTPVKAQHSRRPSFQIPAWLDRASGRVSSAAPSPSLKTMQISDPQPTNSYDAAARAPGALGKGATVVRTPQQALVAGSFPVAETPDEKDEFDASQVVDIKPQAPPIRETAPLVISGIPRRESPAPRRESPVPRRDSPILRQGSPGPSRASPIPSGLRSLHTSKSYSQLQSFPRKATSSPLPSRNPPMPLNLVPSSRQPLSRSALKPPSPTKSTSSNGQFLPLLPPPRQTSKETPPTTPLPPFHPVLLSGVPTHSIPPSQVIITLETSNLTQRTTVATLTSRPSRLASYLQALVPSASNDSNDTSFSSLFAAHLAQAGLAPQAHTSHSGPIHIFLDRPSAPYAHILTYLRSGTHTAGILPRAASLALSSEPARVEALCELRDEARYLELMELVELCDKELRARAPKLRSTASSSSLREFKFGSGSEGSGGRASTGQDALESRLKDYRFGAPAVPSLREEEGEEEQPAEVPPIIYEKRGSHAGMVMTVPPRGVQPTSTQLGNIRASARSPPPQTRMRTISEVRYTQTQDGRLWI